VIASQKNARDDNGQGVPDYINFALNKEKSTPTAGALRPADSEIWGGAGYTVNFLCPW
jgi:hypothetical protein